MDSTLSITDDSETCATAARDAINARLALLADGDLDFWRIVAKLYARGLSEPVVEAAAEMLEKAA